MKTLIKLFVFILSTSFLNAQEVSNASITVTINNVPSNKGKVIMALHTADTFMKGGGIQNSESIIKDGKVIVTFENVAPGTYAVIALHDLNENGRMDFQENGMPMEDFGTSNNTMSFGPPQFSESKFEMTNEDLEITIKF